MANNMQVHNVTTCRRQTSWILIETHPGVLISKTTIKVLTTDLKDISVDVYKSVPLKSYLTTRILLF